MHAQEHGNFFRTTKEKKLFLNNASNFFKQEQEVSPPQADGQISITPLEKSDIPEFINVAKKIYDEIYPGFFTSKDQDELFFQKQLEKILANPNHILFVAKIDNKMIGFAKAKKIHKNQYLLIDKICVLKNYQGNSCGKFLIQACYQFAYKNNIPKAVCSINDAKLSLKDYLYKNFGFSYTEEKHPYYNNRKIAGYNQVMVCHNIRLHLNANPSTIDKPLTRPKL